MDFIRKEQNYFKLEKKNDNLKQKKVSMSLKRAYKYFKNSLVFKYLPLFSHNIPNDISYKLILNLIF